VVQGARSSIRRIYLSTKREEVDYRRKVISWMADDKCGGGRLDDEAGRRRWKMETVDERGDIFISGAGKVNKNLDSCLPSESDKSTPSENLKIHLSFTRC
jgi:hypothetical protein